jgi:hypothetical protein
MRAPHIASPAVWLALLATLGAYGALVLPTVDRQGVNWDEQTDLDIASVYAQSRGGLVYGSAADAINTRLPMFATGVFFRLAGRESLRVARLLSVLIAVLTIAAVFAFCALELDATKGLVAAGILATSPYFLFFGKLALTEGDVWITGGLVLLLVAMAHYRAGPALGRAAVVGVALGLALSAKISGMALVPAVALVLWTERETGDSEVARGESPGLATPSRWPLWLSLGALTVWMAVNLAASLAVYGAFGLSLHPAETLPLVRLGVGVLLAALLTWHVVARRDTRVALGTVYATVMVTAATTFLLGPPVHTTNPRILGALVSEFLRAGGGLDLGFLAEAALFHVEVVTLKSSLVVGVGLWVGLAVAIHRRRARPGLRMALLSLGFYGAFVVLLPWAQTRYMMPLLPLLAIFAADALVDLYRRRHALAVGIGSVAAVFLVVDLWAAYPDLNLNGYPWVGERYLTGRATLGYRALVHTPSDGIEQSLRWVGERASAGETVAMVFGETHIAEAVLPDPAFAAVFLLHEPVGVDAADWVVTSINYDIVQRRFDNPNSDDIFAYPYYDRSQLERDFEKVFAVTRAFGIEVAAVWRRTRLAEVGRELSS